MRSAGPRQKVRHYKDTWAEPQRLTSAWLASHDSKVWGDLIFLLQHLVPFYKFVE